MAHFLAGDDKHRDLTYDDDYRSYLVTPSDSPSDYTFGRTRGKRVGVRTALSRVNGFLKNMIEAIAKSKLQRMEREIELRGIRFGRPNTGWVARNSDPTSAREH